jgi:CubicO group peptidase (beta-lactamase class C family)
VNIIVVYIKFTSEITLMTQQIIIQHSNSEIMSRNIQASCTIVSFIVALLLFFQPATAQYNFTDLESKLTANKKDIGESFCIMINKDGKNIFTKTVGEFNPKTQAPIASCSKWLTAALIMILVDEGKISLDDRVSKYIPLFSKYSKGYITIKQCLSHLTGIASEPIKLSSILQRNRFSNLEEEVVDFASKKEIESNPGIEFRYSNIGLNIAGRVAEIVSKKGFDQLMQEKLLRPLQMRNTSFSSLNAVNPSGGALSTANDYMNFLTMLLNKGMFNGKRILSEQAIALMYTTQTNGPMIKYAPKVAAGWNYGLGVWIQETDVNAVATVVSSPGLFGTWPLIDQCRGYSFILFTKELISVDKRDLYLQIKAIIDQQIVANCK